MQRSLLRQTALALGLLCLLSACGFQLRGTGGTSLPESWKTLHLSIDNPNGELSRELQNTFSAHDIVWVAQEDANYTLMVSPERFRQRNLSINAEARASEFELSLSTNFAVIDPQGQEVIEPSEALVIKQMENDPTNVVGKAEEVRLLKTEMRTELVQKILRRIGYFATSISPDTSTSTSTP